MSRTPRKHQARAVATLVKKLKQHMRGQVHMACGTGKTLVGAWVADALSVRKVVVFVPALALIYQGWREFVSVSKREVLAVCSEAMRTPTGEVLDTTENADEVRAFLAKPGPRVVFCTYQSAPVLDGLSFDLGIFDEAHKTAGTADKFFGYALHDTNISITKRVFMTATPRHVEPGKDTPVHSMDDEAVYGPLLYRFSFREAVAAGVVCNYKIVVSAIRHRHVITDNMTALQVAVAKAMKKYQLSKVLTYHRTIAAAQSFTSGVYADRFPAKTELHHVNNTQTASNRHLAMRSFEEAPRAVMSNARCLIEGVDIPAVDLVTFADPKSSYVDLVQAIGRAVRRPANTNKKYGYILLPLFIDDVAGESVETAIQRAQFDATFDVVSILQEQDDILANRLLDLAVRGKEGSLFNSNDLVELDLEDGLVSTLSLEALKQAISVRVVNKAVSSRMKCQARLLDMAKRGLPRPSTSASDADEAYLGNSLVDFTNTKSGRFDKTFNAAIRKAAPAWFLSSSDQTKQQILARAKSGGPPPLVRTGGNEKRLAQNLYGYLREGSKTYDPAFAAQLRKIAPPGWLSLKNHVDSLKEKLWTYAETTTKRPTTGKTGPERQMIRAFRRYTNPLSKNYDATLTRKLRELRPHWFNAKRKFRGRLVDMYA